MAQIFTISDGTTTIDLLNPTGNYHLASWETGVSEWKDGGQYSNNPLVDGSIPVDRAYNNFEEKITIHITGSSQNNVIDSMRSLIALLDKSFKYFKDNLTNPVYLSVKGDTETNTRHAVIVGYKIETLPEQFIGPFLTGGIQSGLGVYTAIYKEVELTITRYHWLDNTPGNSDSIAISNQYSYNSVTYGQAATSSNPIYITSKRNEANITHIYRFDSSASSWSSNIFGSGLPHSLLPSSTTAGDIVYFGINTAIANSGPIQNLIFNISQASSGITGAWEHYEGSWQTSTGIDYTKAFTLSNLASTASFTKTGLGEMVFESSFQQAANLNTLFGGSAPSVNAFWIRYRVTSVSSPTVPQQGTQQVFTATRPYIDINSASIAGDIESFSKVTVRGRVGRKTFDLSGNYYSAGSMFIGLRKYSRGSLFTSYLNCSDEQNPSGITCSTSGSYIDIPANPSGRGTDITVAANSTNPSAVSFYFDSTIANHFLGKFRVFLRAAVATGTVGSVLVNLLMRTSEVDLYTSEYTPITAISGGGAANYAVTDLGVLNIPNSSLISNSTSVDILQSLEIAVGVRNISSSVSSSVRFMDLVLIPADESIVEVRELLNDVFGDGFDYTKNLEIDNLSYPLKSARAITRAVDTNNINGIYRLINANGLMIPTERSQLHFLYFDRHIPISSTSLEYTRAATDAKNLFTIKLNTNNRYIMPRGSV